MKTALFLAVFASPSAAFVARLPRATKESFIALRAFQDADALLDKLFSAVPAEVAVKTVAPVAAVVAPPIPPVLAEVVIKTVADTTATPVTAVVAPPVPPVVADVPVPEPVADAVEAVTNALPDVDVETISNAVSLPDLSSVGNVGDILPIAVGGLAIAAAVAFLVGGGGHNSEAKAAPPLSTPAAVDLSIPYDAAARLAYEKAGRPGNYQVFKEKYEADAVADVKAKQKK